MGEKRKPDLVILLKIRGKTNKLELFRRNLFEDVYNNLGRANRYRIRCNGKWFDKGEGYVGKKYFTKWEFRDLMFKSLDI